MPKLHLAIDNCFASKRWTDPDDWCRVVSDLGLRYVEASADTEADVFYRGREHMLSWTRDVKAAERRYGLRVANLYSGHGTYATLGLAHTEPAVADRFVTEWVRPMIEVAGELGAGFGFFAHAFPVTVLDDPMEYDRARRTLVERLSVVARMAAETLDRPASIEQMYTPHQFPWTIEGALQLLRQIHAVGSTPLYLTLDVGHQCGQRRFSRPSAQHFRASVEAARIGNWDEVCWLGPQDAYTCLLDAESGRMTVAEAWNRVKLLIDDRAYLFAQAKDGDTYSWLRALGTHSPIIHLQQTDGTSSGHRPFTRKNNTYGVVRGDRVLQALAAAYEDESVRIPIPKTRDIFLTLEVFAPTFAQPFTIIQELRESVNYWRQFIPDDGIELTDALQLSATTAADTT